MMRLTEDFEQSEDEVQLDRDEKEDEGRHVEFR